MRAGLANRLFIASILLYLAAGIYAFVKKKFSIILILAAIIFLALGFFCSMKITWKKLSKKSPNK